MPPRVASAPGSTGKKTPSGRSAASSLHADVEVLDRQAQDAVHLAHVDADAALQRLDVALERRAGAEGHDRRTVAGADADDRRGLLGARRVDDRVRHGRRMEGLVDAVLLADVVAGEDTVGAEQDAQVVEELLGLRVREATVLNGRPDDHAR
jgi:hypothetical protein